MPRRAVLLVVGTHTAHFALPRSATIPPATSCPVMNWILCDWSSSAPSHALNPNPSCGRSFGLWRTTVYSVLGLRFPKLSVTARSTTS